MAEKRRRCFVIGPIGDAGSPERKHADMLLHNVIREALKDGEPPYEVARSDEIDDPGMITDRMIHEIMNAELVIADLTYLNANAFYELGIRHAAEKPAIHFAQSGTKLPFDAMTHRAVIQDITSWEGTKRARQQIRDAAKVTEASDYRVSNPITQANATFKMRESSDPTDQVIADLQIRIERLERHDNIQVIDQIGFIHIHFLPSVNNDVDRMLIAGHLVGSRSNDRSFSTGEATALLAAQGVVVNNPSQLMKENLIAKRVFRFRDRFRLSATGADYLSQLLSPSPDAWPSSAPSSTPTSHHAKLGQLARNHVNPAWNLPGERQLVGRGGGGPAAASFSSRPASAARSLQEQANARTCGSIKTRSARYHEPCFSGTNNIERWRCCSASSFFTGDMAGQRL